MLNKNRHFIIIATSSLMLFAGCDDTKTRYVEPPREKEFWVVFNEEAEAEEPDQSHSTLKKAGVMQVVKENTSKLKECMREQANTGDPVKGKLTVEFKVDPSGRVLDVRILEPRFKGTVVADCMSKMIRQLRFPEFEGEPKTVTLPFRVQPGR